MRQTENVVKMVCMHQQQSVMNMVWMDQEQSVVNMVCMLIRDRHCYVLETTVLSWLMSCMLHECKQKLKLDCGTASMITCKCISCYGTC